jgi:hypothetical protein
MKSRSNEEKEQTVRVDQSWSDNRNAPALPALQECPILNSDREVLSMQRLQQEQ